MSKDKYMLVILKTKKPREKVNSHGFCFHKNFFYALLNPLNLLLKCGCFNLRIAFCSI